MMQVRCMGKSNCPDSIVTFCRLSKLRVLELYPDINKKILRFYECALITNKSSTTSTLGDKK